MLRGDYQMVSHVPAGNMSSWCPLLAEMPPGRGGESAAAILFEDQPVQPWGEIPGLVPAQPGRAVKDRIPTSARVTRQNQWQSWGTTWTTPVESLPRTEHYEKPRTSSQQIWEEDYSFMLQVRRARARKPWEMADEWQSSPLPFWYFLAVLQTRGHLMRHSKPRLQRIWKKCCCWTMHLALFTRPESLDENSQYPGEGGGTGSPGIWRNQVVPEKTLRNTHQTPCSLR